MSSAAGFYRMERVQLNGDSNAFLKLHKGTELSKFFRRINKRKGCFKGSLFM